MAWFDAYESLSKRNKWKKMATDSEKRIEAKRLVREQEAKDKKKLEDDARRETIQSRLQWFRENERVSPVKKEQAVTPTPSRRRDPTSLTDYSQPPTSIMGGFPRDDPDYFSGGKFYAEQMEERRRKRADRSQEEISQGRATFERIEKKLEQDRTTKEVKVGVDALEIENQFERMALRIVLEPESTIPIGAFDKKFTRDFIMAVRSGDVNRIKELNRLTSVRADILSGGASMFATKKDLPSTLYSQYIGDEKVEELKELGYGGLIDKYIRDEVIFAATVEELLTFDRNELLQQYRPDRVVLKDEARAFFIEDDAEREAALLSLPWEEQIQFSLQWVFGLQEDKIEEGRYDELTPVPGLGEYYKNIALTIVDETISENRKLTDDEKQAATPTFTSLVIRSCSNFFSILSNVARP